MNVHGDNTFSLRSGWKFFIDSSISSLYFAGICSHRIDWIPFVDTKLKRVIEKLMLWWKYESDVAAEYSIWDILTITTTTITTPTNLQIYKSIKKWAVFLQSSSSVLYLSLYLAILVIVLELSI